MDEKSLFEQLQEILLSEERQATSSLKEDVSVIKDKVSNLEDELGEIRGDVTNIQEGIDDPDKFSTKVDPFIEKYFDELRKNFYQYFGYEINAAIKKGIEESQDDFINAIHPIMGRLIRKYIRYEFDSFIENVNSRVENTFSMDWWKNRAKSIFTGVKQSDMLIKDSLNSEIVEVFVIHRESGLLIGSYSKSNMSDVDMIAGMLTAIKTFVENTFQSSNADDTLEVIQYGNFNILVNNFHKYYIATVVSGSTAVSSQFKLQLSNHLSDFAEHNIPRVNVEVDDTLYKRISQKLKEGIESFEGKSK